MSFSPNVPKETEMPLENCVHCGQLFPHTLEFFSPIQNKYKKKEDRGPSKKCIVCFKAERKLYNDRRKNARLENRLDLPLGLERKVFGRVEETPTKEGRVVRFGEEWKPTRGEKQCRAPGFLGYASPLGSL